MCLTFCCSEKNEHFKVAVNTVDSFQGSENDIVIISCVRDSSNSFLQNRNRLNVALTRAKQALYIIGNYTLFKVSNLTYFFSSCPDIYHISLFFIKMFYFHVTEFLLK